MIAEVEIWTHPASGEQLMTVSVKVTRKAECDFSVDETKFNKDTPPQELADEAMRLYTLWRREVSQDMIGELTRRVIHERLIPKFRYEG